MLGLITSLQSWLAPRTDTALITAPCDGLVVEVATSLESAGPVDRVVVRIQSSESGDIVPAVGSLRSGDEVGAALGAGRVDAVFVEVGDYVRAGEVLARVASPTTIAASRPRSGLVSLVRALSRRTRPTLAPAASGATNAPVVSAVARSVWIPWLSDTPSLDVGQSRRREA